MVRSKVQRDQVAEAAVVSTLEDAVERAVYTTLKHELTKGRPPEVQAEIDAADAAMAAFRAADPDPFRGEAATRWTVATTDADEAWRSTSAKVLDRANRGTAEICARMIGGVRADPEAWALQDAQDEVEALLKERAIAFAAQVLAARADRDAAGRMTTVVPPGPTDFLARWADATADDRRDRRTDDAAVDLRTAYIAWDDAWNGIAAEAVSVLGLEHDSAAQQAADAAVLAAVGPIKEKARAELGSAIRSALNATGTVR